MYSQLTFDKDTEAIQWGVEKSFQKAVLEKLIIHVRVKNRLLSQALNTVN